MGLWPTHRDENRFEPKPLRSTWRGTAKTGATLDLLRPMTSLVWAPCLYLKVKLVRTEELLEKGYLGKS